MTLDDLISGADPAAGRTFRGGTVEQARRLMDQLEADPQLVAGGPRAGRPRGPRRIASILVPACAILVAGLVIALAGLVGHRGRTHRPAAPATSRPSSPRVPRSVALGPDVALDRALLGEFGILRQPQTAAARAFNTAPKLGVRLAQRVPFVPSLTRAIALPHRVILYLYVAQRRKLEVPKHGGEHVIQDGGLGVQLRAPYQGFGSCCSRPQDLRKPVAPQATPYTMSQKPTWLYVELVPDGVATVRWTFPASTAPGARATHGGRTVTVRVHNNVAATALPHTGTSNSSGTASVAWYSADGRLITRHTS